MSLNKQANPYAINESVKEVNGPFSEADWIWTRGKTRLPFHVSYFRNVMSMKETGKKVLLRCCADSRYILWVNGVRVGAGPARSNAANPYFDTYNIGPLLKRGGNVIAFLVQHYTSGLNIFAAVQGGLICQVSIGGKVLTASDRNWRAISSGSYDSMSGFLYPEVYDASLKPRGWRDLKFDPTSWEFARELKRSKLAPGENLLPRPIPQLTEDLCLPERILEGGICRDPETKNLAGLKEAARSLSRSVLEPDTGPFNRGFEFHARWEQKDIRIKPIPKGKSVYLFLDFGKGILASPEFRIRGPRSTIMDIGYSEVLEDNRVEPMYQGVEFSDRIILGNGLTEHRLLQPRGFRYLYLRFSNFRAPVKIEKIQAYESVYPARYKGVFKSSDALLEKIHKLSARTLNLCMEDAFTDCPWRERSQWLGDVQPEALINYYCFGAYDLARKAVLEYAGGNTEEGWIPGVFPVTDPFNLPTWGMRFPVIAWEYYMFTGDKETLEAANKGVKRQMSWLAKHESRGGLIDEIPGWCFVDWTRTDAEKGDGAVQGWYAEALDHSALIAAEVGDELAAGRYKRKAEKLRKTIAREYWSKELKGFLKYSPKLSRRPEFAPPELLGQHENFLFTRLKIGTAQMRRQALEAIKGETGGYLPNLGNYQSYYRDKQCGNVSSEKVLKINSPFWSFYALLALMEAGKDQEALDYIRLGWGLMLEHGATSCWEMWDRNASHCHGWSAAPGMILQAYVLGVKPEKPGFRRFSVKPKLVDLKWAGGTVPTPCGDIKVSWRINEKGRGKVDFNIIVPEGTTGIFTVPRECEKAKGGKLKLGPGEHEFSYALK